MEDEDGGPLDKIVVTEYSPDNLIKAKLFRQDQLDIQFRPGAYKRYQTETLESQLAQLAARVWVEYQRAYYRSLSEVCGETISGDEQEQSPRIIRYKQAQTSLSVLGASPHSWIEVRSSGLMRWRFRITRGALGRLTEEEFLAELSSALRALLDDYSEKIRMLKDEFFDLRLPKDNRHTSGGRRRG